MYNMYKLILVFIAYIYIMYKSYNKIKENQIEMIRFKDTITRFTFLQLAFGLYDFFIGKFELEGLIFRILFSHIGVASYSLIKEYIDKVSYTKSYTF